MGYGTMNGSTSTRLWLHLAMVVVLLVLLGVIASGGATGHMGDIQATVGSLAGNVLHYALVVGAVGTVSMALVEFIKAVGDLRRYFHEWQVRLWIRDSRSFMDLLFLAIGDMGRSDALFGQPVEKLMGQVQAAANVALDFPDKYPELYRFLTTTDVPSPPGAVRAGVAASGGPAVTDRAVDDRELWHRHVVTNRLRAGIAPGAAATSPPPEQIDAAKARIRLGNLMSRKLDAFQIRTQYYWDRSNQLAGVLISMALMDYALILANKGEIPPLPVLMLGLLSGAVAPFAKDLSSALSQFSRK